MPIASIRIYLAGPEVFLADAQLIGVRKKQLCAAHGFEGAFPLDNEVELAGLPPREAALKIGQCNEALIRSCQTIIANLTPFRGISADVGTAFELGFARALGLPVFGYSNVSEPFAARTVAALKLPPSDALGLCDNRGMAIENWGLADNLMLESAIAASGGAMILRDAPADERFTDLRGFELCLKAVRARLG